jgi:hypothetical protein
VKRAAFALSALAAVTVAVAQQTTPSTSAQPQTSTTTPQEQTAPPAPSSTPMSQADKQSLMNKCMTQIQAANPTVPEKEIRAYCDKEINNMASPR